MLNTEPRVSWKIEEYNHRDKGPDWYWALGVVAIAGATIAIIVGNALFGIVIILAAIILGAYAKREPAIIEVAISEAGITLRDQLYLFEKIKGFAIDQHDLGTFLLIETDRAFMPRISIPLPLSLDPEGVSELLRTKIPEKPLKEPVSHKLMEYLGF